MVSPSFISNSALNLLYMSFLLTTLLTADTQARIGYFWHITDLHLDTIYSTQGDPLRSCWRIERQPPSSSTRSPGRFGDYLCDSPWSLIESAARAMKSRQGDNVEFVLWTGDGLSHSAHPMFESKKLEILRNITDLLGRTFSSQFVFPVLGHEDGTTTNFRHMGELWRHWLPSEALQTFEKGGYYSIEQTKSRLRIIALNTNFMRHDPKYSQSHLAAVRQRQPGDASEYKNFYYHHGNQHQHHGHSSGDWSASSASASLAALGYGYSSHHRGIGSVPGAMQQDVASHGGRVSALSEYENQDTEKQWIWLEDVLTKSKNNKETVYIVGHIPPGSDERHIGIQQNGHTTFTENNNKRYLELVRKYSSIIQGQFFGHLHSDSFRIIYDDKGKPVSWMMISPSVTPRKTNIGSNNPAMRLYKFDTDSGQVLDYTQFYLDLQLANTLGEPNWLPEYNLTHYYGLNDISAISLHNFVDRFTSSDGSWFAKYYRANTVRYQTDVCEGVCLLNHYCAITRIDYKEFRQCLEKERHALTSDAPALATPSIVLSTACPLLALLLTLAATCCRTTMLLLPKILRQSSAMLATRANPVSGQSSLLTEMKIIWLQVLRSICKKMVTSTTTITTTTTTTTTTNTLDTAIVNNVTVILGENICNHNNSNSNSNNNNNNNNNNNCHQRAWPLAEKFSSIGSSNNNNSNNNNTNQLQITSSNNLNKAFYATAVLHKWINTQRTTNIGNNANTTTNTTTNNNNNNNNETNRISNGINTSRSENSCCLNTKRNNNNNHTPVAGAASPRELLSHRRHCVSTAEAAVVVAVPLLLIAAVPKLH